MTENEAIEALKLEGGIEITGRPIRVAQFFEGIDLAIKALEEVQQYRAIGTPEELQDMKNNYFEALSDWRQYRKIGTLEECRAAVEQLENERKFWEHAYDKDLGKEKARSYAHAIEIVEGGGVDG